MSDWNQWNTPQTQQTQQTQQNYNAGAPPSPWENFDQVEAQAPRNGYLPPGLDGVMEIVQLKTVSSVKNNNRPIFVASLRFISGVGALEGQQFDWVAKADETAYLQNIKTLISSIKPEGDPRSIGKEVMEAMCGPEQPATGRQVRVRSEQILTQRGNEFTKVYWSPA